MRMTIHNARTSKLGAFTPRHNDRNFDISHAEHIDPERTGENIYWNWTGESNISFEDAEKLFYEQHCRTHLDAKNARYVAQRHPERVRTMDEYRRNPRTCPEETILMIGNKNEYIPAKTLQAICEDLRNWEEKQIPGLRVLNMALHVDEQGAPHIHMRKAWIYRDENGIESIAQNKALQAAGSLRTTRQARQRKGQRLRRCAQEWQRKKQGRQKQACRKSRTRKNTRRNAPRGRRSRHRSKRAGTTHSEPQKAKFAAKWSESRQPPGSWQR